MKILMPLILISSMGFNPLAAAYLEPDCSRTFLQLAKSFISQNGDQMLQKSQIKFSQSSTLVLNQMKIEDVQDLTPGSYDITREVLLKDILLQTGNHTKKLTATMTTEGHFFCDNEKVISAQF